MRNDNALRRAQRRPEWAPAPARHPCARAEQRSGMGGARASRASLTCSLHLSELNERSEWCELCNAPMPRAAQVAPDAARRQGSRAPGSPSLCLLSLGETRESRSPCGGDHPAPERRADIGVLSNQGSLAEDRGGDFAPAGDSLFLSRQEKEAKEGDPGPRVPPLRYGQPAVLTAWAHCTTRTVRCAHSARTGAMSQSTKRAMLARRPCRSAPQHGHRGWDRSPFGPSLRSALFLGGHHGG